MIIHNAVAAPVRAARGRGSACAKVVGASTSHGVGTSATARMPTAYVRSVAGSTASRGSGQSQGCRGSARAPTARQIFPSTESLRRCGDALSRSKNFVAATCVRPAGMFCSTPHVGAPAGVLLWPRLPSSGSQGAGARTQVAAARHFPRPPGPQAGVRGCPRTAVPTATEHRGRDALTRPAPVNPRAGCAGLPVVALPCKPHSLGRSV